MLNRFEFIDQGQGDCHLRVAAKPQIVGRDMYIWGIIIVALILRVYHLTSLSLWLDEGSTIRISKLTVPQLLGSSGVYDTHPPLYYLIVHYLLKLAPDVLAGRLVSAIAGTLSVSLVYLLGTELWDRRAGRMAAFLTAVSPLHIWYSQEARMYALLGATILASYLALLLALERQRPWQWAAYILSTSLALYADYSAVLTLLPQLLLLPLMLRRTQNFHRLVVALVVIVVAYLPWMSHVRQTFALVSSNAFALPAIDPVGPRHLLLTALDFAGLDSTYFFGVEFPWTRWTGSVAILLLIQLLLVSRGIWALRVRPGWAFRLGGLLAIPPIALLLLSLITPMYWTRTLYGSSFAFVLLLVIGIASFGRAPGFTGIALTLVFLVATLGPAISSSVSMYSTAEKQEWNKLADDLSIGASSYEAVLYYPAVAQTLVNAYFVPAERGAIERAIGEGAGYDQIDESLATSVLGLDSVWLVYQEWTGLDMIRQWLQRHGYKAVLHKTYWYPLGLELYTRQWTSNGTNILLNGDFRLLTSGGEPRYWDFGGEHALDNGALVQIGKAADSTNDATRTVALEPRALYFLTFEYRNLLATGSQRVFVLLFDSTGELLETVPHGAGFALPANGAWSRATLAFLTPSRTVNGTVVLRNSGIGKTWFREVFLERP